MIQRKKSHHSEVALIREYKTSKTSIEMLSELGAHSYGIGRKIVKGKITNKFALRIYVAKKQPIKYLKSKEKIPKKIPFFSRNENKDIEIVTDIIETPPAQFQPIDPTDRTRPVPGGISIGNPLDTGTIGGWVWDKDDDTIVMLSNDHVFGHTAGDCIMQPGPVADGGTCVSDRIGEVKRGIARTNDPAHPNIVDCAIGEPDSSAIYDLRVLEIGPAVYAIAESADDMMVEKYGRTTEHTYGEITDNDWAGYVSGRPFADCFRVDNRAPSLDWSAGGDSGSLVFSQDFLPNSEIKPVVGLHFAGGGTHGIECKIQNVFSHLNLTTLCSGAFSAFLDSLFESHSESLMSKDKETRLKALSAMALRTPKYYSPALFTKTDKNLYMKRGFYAGISRDIQSRIVISKRGRVVTNFVDGNRAMLLDLIARDGDVRRATVSALRPILAGAETTTDVLGRVLLKNDLIRLKKLAKEVSRKGDRKLQIAMKPIIALSSRAEGKSLADILQIKL